MKMKGKIIWKLEGHNEHEKIIESYADGYGCLKAILDLLRDSDRKLEKFEVN